MQWPPGKKHFLKWWGKKKILPKPCMASDLCNPTSLYIQMPQHPGTWPPSNAPWVFILHLSSPAVCHLNLFHSWCEDCSVFWFVQDLVESWAWSITTLTQTKSPWCPCYGQDQMTQASAETIFLKIATKPRGILPWPLVKLPVNPEGPQLMLQGE